MTTLSMAQYTVIAVVVVTVVVAVVRFELLCFNDLAQRSDRELNYLSRTAGTTRSRSTCPSMIVSGSRSSILRAAYDRDHGRVRLRRPPPIEQRNNAVAGHERRVERAADNDMVAECFYCFADAKMIPVEPSKRRGS